jgi:hypothetical protein
MAIERTRLTITIENEALQAFREMADAAGISLGKTIGDWCADTVEGAKFTTAKLIEARNAPRKAMDDFTAARDSRQLDMPLPPGGRHAASGAQARRQRA